MENLKNEFCNELLKNGFSTQDVVRALNALSKVVIGYNIATKEANLVVYNSQDVTDKLITLYLSCKRIENCSEDYLLNMKMMLPKLFLYAKKGVKEINSFDIRAFLDYWKTSHGIQGNTLDYYRAMYYRFYSWLVSEGYMTKNPVDTIKPIRKEHKEAEALTPMEIEIIRASLKDWREKVLIEFLLSTGCRARELCQAKVSDVDFKARRVLLHCKGKKEHYGLLTERAIIAIQEYIDTRGFESEYIYPSTYAGHKMLSVAAIERNISKIENRLAGKIYQHLHPHLFRHTSATIWLYRGMPLQDVQVALGHSKIDTTRRYTKVDNTLTQLAHSKYAV